ncbi:MAG TPA: hypothetical protein VF809_01010, partial [Candidatus Saccharimonadales bacterium]
EWAVIGCPEDDGDAIKYREEAEARLIEASINAQRFIIPDSAGGEAISHERWKQVLTDGFGEDSGISKEDLDNMALNMQGFREGMDFVYETFTNKGVPFARPPIAIVTDPAQQNEGAFYYNGYTGEVQIVARYLKVNGRLDPGCPGALYTSGTQELVFTGVAGDIFRLAGVEEMHHSHYSRMRQDNVPESGRHADSIAMYHAVDIEWHALRWKIMFAERAGMPEPTIRLLKKFRDDAKEIRRLRQAAKRQDQ